MLDSRATNNFFAGKAKEVNVEVPYYFEPGGEIHWNELIENIFVILEAQINKKFEEIRNDE